ncbi:MAG: glycosyltransferase family 39 protein [Desulfobacterales bacterium]|nr:glycosyltransferase family 39 protein [Deltaproteobacteria bacterium]MBL6970664.1 glycosyltransferase family 39 protein [Desulfobacterales bacterium]
MEYLKYRSDRIMKILQSNGTSLLFVFFLAFTLRLLYVLQYQSSPFFLNLIGDGQGYFIWGRKISGGDWIGNEVFYQAPLYPYFLGVLQKYLSPDLFWIRFVQIILGSFSCLFIYKAGSLFLNKTSGFLSGLLMCFYAPAIFFDGLIQKTCLSFFFLSLFFWIFARTIKKSKPFDFLLNGFVLGLLSLVRENALILAPCVIFCYMLRFNLLKQKTIKHIALFVVGMTLALGPITARNWFVGNTFAITTSQFGTNLYIGNNPNATGTYVPLKPGGGVYTKERKDASYLSEIESGKKLSPGEVSRHWSSKVINYIKDNPSDWLKLMWKKWLLLWNKFEIPDTDDYYIHQNWSSLLKNLDYIFNFGVLMPIALLGFLLTWHRKKDLYELYLVFVILVTSILVFYVFGRYRFVLIPLIILFAGTGIRELFDRLRKKKYRSLVICMVVVGAIGVFSNQPCPIERMSRCTGHFSLGNIYMNLKEYQKAAMQFSFSIAILPEFNLSYNNRGLAYIFLRQYNLALADFNKSISLRPDFADSYYFKAILLHNKKPYTMAQNYYLKAIELQPTEAKYYRYLGDLLQKMGKFKEAADTLAKASELESNSTDAKTSFTDIKK